MNKEDNFQSSITLVKCLFKSSFLYVKIIQGRLQLAYFHRISQNNCEKISIKFWLIFGNRQFSLIDNFFPVTISTVHGKTMKDFLCR